MTGDLLKRGDIKCRRCHEPALAGYTVGRFKSVPFPRTSPLMVTELYLRTRAIPCILGFTMLTLTPLEFVDKWKQVTARLLALNLDRAK